MSIRNTRNLSDAARQQIALALLLLRDFKSQGKFDVEVTKFIFGLVCELDLVKEYNDLLSKVPTMKIEPR